MTVVIGLTATLPAQTSDKTLLTVATTYMQTEIAALTPLATVVAQTVRALEILITLTVATTTTMTAIAVNTPNLMEAVATLRAPTSV
jgi:hypothetical protein